MSLFKFDYRAPEELEPKKVDLLPGECKFRIVAVFDKRKDGAPLTTMDGTPKLTISFSMTDSAGSQGLVYDDLTAKTAWKIKALLDALGLEDLYDASGTLNPDDILGGVGRCVIELKKSEGYPDKMSVKRYLKASKQANVIKRDYSTEIADDDIPF